MLAGRSVSTSSEPAPSLVGRSSVPPDSGRLSLQIAATPHFEFLDGMRGFAALYVMLHHIAIHVPPAAGAAPAERALRYVFDFGHDAVDVFIVLSGYCLMLPVLRKQALDAGAFIKRRALRILPPYYAALLGSWLLIATVIGKPTGTHWDFSIPVHRLDVLTHLTLFQDWVAITTPKINHPHWSVAVEWKIYFLFPPLWLAWRKWGGSRTVAYTTLLSYGVWVVLHHFQWLNPSPWGSSVYYVGLFSFGMLVAELGESAPARLAQVAQGALATLLVTTLLLALLTTFDLGHRPLPPQLRSGLVGVWAAALMLCLRLRCVPDALARLFQLQAPRWVGRIGFSLYLTHAPIVQLVYLWVVRPLGVTGLQQMLLFFGVATPACLLVAYGFYVAVEVPSHERSRRAGTRVTEGSAGLVHSGTRSR